MSVPSRNLECIASLMRVLQGQKKVKYFTCWLHGDNYSLQQTGVFCTAYISNLYPTPSTSTLKSMYTNLDSDRSAHFLLCYLFRHEILSVLQNYTLKQKKQHVDPRCQQYHPDIVRETIPDMNTMACEQTFACVSRYKKILSAMPKTHHHFYLHRMVQRRNKYLSLCYALGRKPVQPRVRHVGDV